MKKRSMRKRILALAVACLLAVTCVLPAAAASQEVTAQICPHFTIVVDGQERTFANAQGDAVYPILYWGTTYLPVRAIGELMGKNVGWNGPGKTVTLEGQRTGPIASPKKNPSATQESVAATLRMDFTILVDGQPQQFVDAAGNTVYPLLHNGTTYPTCPHHNGP